jgi:hypothetical protein
MINVCRKLRLHHGLLFGLRVWLRETEDLINSQLDAYRMNVEGELLSDIADSSRASKDIQPSEKAILRLQNNVSTLNRDTF